jgi:hypothetical protein
LGRSAVNRPHCMNYKSRRQAISLGNFGTARLASPQGPTLLQKLRSCCAMDCPIDTTATKQRTIGRIDNCIDAESSDITLVEFDLIEQAEPFIFSMWSNKRSGFQQLYPMIGLSPWHKSYAREQPKLGCAAMVAQSSSAICRRSAVSAIPPGITISAYSLVGALYSWC